MFYFFDHLSKISFDEILHFMEQKGIDLQVRLHGHARRKIDTFGEYITAITVNICLCSAQSSLY